MFEEYNAQLAEAKEKLRQRDKWTSLLNQYRNQLTDAEARRDAAQAQLHEEESELKRLEGLSLAHLFHSLLGHQDEKVEESKQELLAAKLKFDTAQQAVHQLQTDIDNLEQRLHALGDVDALYERVLKTKEEAMVQLNTPESQRVFALSHEEADIRSQLKEVNEALDAAGPALDALDRCQDSLQKARDWGAWDMFGGGMIATAIKRDHMSDAQQYVYEAQTQLRRLQAELSDLHIPLDIDIEGSGFMKFADYFFDGLIVDWMVQNELRDSAEQVSAQQSAVATVQSRLTKEQADLQARLGRVSAERIRLIESL